MLRSETMTPEMEKRILRAARKSLGKRGLLAWFEHGQWWIICNKTGAIWSVVDAEGGPAVDGFDFEQVSEGEQ
jgi:predicted transcriptional regulator of viral defense system